MDETVETAESDGSDSKVIEVEVHKHFSRSGNGRLIGGITLVVLGSLFLVDNLLDWDVGYLWNYWPLILIAIGVAKLTRGWRRGGGFFLIVLGAFFLFDELDLLYAEDTWPVLIMALGGIMITTSILRQGRTSETS